MKNEELKCSNKMCFKKNSCNKFYIPNHNEIFINLMEYKFKCYEKKKNTLKIKNKIW